jgi:L-ascorbate metabolism protein UlaG (beta-lactamase superfamily)
VAADRARSELRLSYLGHAAVAVELAGTLLLTDPVLRPRVAFLRWTAPTPRLEPLRECAAVLVSHLHHDHCDPRSLALLGRHRLLLVPAGAEEFFARRGFSDVVALRPGQSHQVGPVEVTATEAEHDGRREPLGPRALALGFVLRGGGRAVYFAGDTDLFTGMRGLAGDLDVALLPVAGWGPTLGPGHLDPVRAAEAVALLRPALAVPVHWAGLRPAWERAAAPRHATPAPALAFAAAVHDRGLPTDVSVVQPGAVLTLPGRGAQ